MPRPNTRRLAVNVILISCDYRSRLTGSKGQQGQAGGGDDPNKRDGTKTNQFQPMPGLLLLVPLSTNVHLGPA